MNSETNPRVREILELVAAVCIGAVLIALALALVVILVGLAASVIFGL